MTCLLTALSFNRSKDSFVLFYRRLLLGTSRTTESQFFLHTSDGKSFSEEISSWSSYSDKHSLLLLLVLIRKVKTYGMTDDYIIETLSCFLASTHIFNFQNLFQHQ